MSYLIPQPGARPSVSIVLSRPIVHGATRLSVLKFQPSETDLERFRHAVDRREKPVMAVIKLLMSATGLPESIIAKMRSSDLLAVVHQIGGPSSALDNVARPEAGENGRTPGHG